MTPRKARRSCIWARRPGSPSLPPGMPKAIRQNAHFGSAVAGAGDLDGDGMSEIAVGAPDFDGGADGEGKAFVFLGSPSGPETSPAWTAEGDQAERALRRRGGASRRRRRGRLCGSSRRRPRDSMRTHADAGRAFLYRGSRRRAGAHPRLDRRGRPRRGRLRGGPRDGGRRERRRIRRRPGGRSRAMRSPAIRGAERMSSMARASGSTPFPPGPRTAPGSATTSAARSPGREM